MHLWSPNFQNSQNQWVFYLQSTELVNLNKIQLISDQNLRCDCLYKKKKTRIE